MQNHKQNRTHKQLNKFDLPDSYKLHYSQRNKFCVSQAGCSFKCNEHMKALHFTTESTFSGHLIKADHICTNIKINMEILHVNTNEQKLDSLEQLEIYKYIKTYGNNFLHEQTHFKAHIIFQHVTHHSHTTMICQLIQTTY